MNLFELQEEKEDLESDIRYYKRERERLGAKVGVKSIGITDMKVDGHASLNTVQDALDEYTQMGIYLDDAMKKWDNIVSLVSEKYNNYQKHNDYERQIYTEKKLFKWSNAKISARHGGMSRMQINRIVKKIEENENTLQNVTQ